VKEISYFLFISPGLTAVIYYALLIAGKSILLRAGVSLKWEHENLSHIYLFIFILISFLNVYILVSTGNIPSLYRTETGAPASDALGYQHASVQLLEEGTLTDYGSHKPMFPAFVALLMALVGTDINASLNCLALLAFASTLSLVFIINRYCGLFVSLLWGSLAASYFGANVAKLYMSEALGFILANISAALIIPVFYGASIWRVVPGLCLQTFALLSRTGPFFILPVLFLTFFCKMFCQLPRMRLRVIIFSIMLFFSIYGPYLTNKLILTSFESEFEEGFWNFALTLYGLAHGGLGWESVFQDYPELRDATSSIVSSTAYRLALDKLLSEPHLFFKAFAGDVGAFLVGRALFYFVGNPVEQRVFTGLFILAPFILLFNYKSSLAEKVVFISLWLSFVLSLGFLLDGAYRTRIIAGCWWIVPFYIFNTYRFCSLRNLFKKSRSAPSIAPGVVNAS